MKKVIFLAIGCAFLVGFSCLLTIVAVYFSLLQPADPTQVESVKFEVEAGSSLARAAVKLEADGLIKSAWAARIYARLHPELARVQTGTYTLSPSWSLGQILSVLQSSPEQIAITILPGWRREEISEYLARQDLPAFNEELFLQLTRDLEGQLMPETYHLAPASTTETIVTILQEQFQRDLANDSQIQAQVAASGKSFSEILTIASLLQREARDLEQMRMIAGIINNRLADDYPLQLCASAQYATGKDPATGSWWLPPNLLDTQIDSPYNTYVHPGLPPGPICAVSKEAVAAAANPTANDYYFYLHDNQGVIHYGLTLQEHEQNIARYL